SIGTIPISPGGSGLTELGIAYYLNTFNIDPAVFGDVIIVWRIASYHVPLFVSWALLVRSLGRGNSSSSNGSGSNSGGK
ncbi:MAG: hypothetical protein QXI92_04290, partial [Candidatus Nitrosocaldus sp.]